MASVKRKKQQHLSEESGDRSRKLMDPDQIKVCSRCMAKKFLRSDFYLCQGSYRSECKACTIKGNVKHQRKIKVWQGRCKSTDEQKSYMVEYYAKNKEKFAEYRRKFREKYPNYHTEYGRMKRNEKREK